MKHIMKPTLLLLTLFTFIAFFGLKQYQQSSHSQVVSPQTNTTVAANPEQHDILADKTMVAFGDSVTEFGHYPEIIAQNTGMNVHNIGFKGTRLGHHPHSAYDEFSPTKFVDSIVTQDFSLQDAAIQEDRNYTADFIAHYEQLKTIDFNQVDIVSLLIGTNDYMGNHTGAISLGQSTDNSRDTFTGAINYFIHTIQKNYPHIDLVLITPTWRMNHEAFGGQSATIQANANGDYLIEFVDALIDRGEHYNIPILDLYRTSGLNEENHQEFFVDHVHPNEQGYELIGHTISHFLIETFNNQID